MTLSGAGTGVDDAGLAHKSAILAQASQRTAPSLSADTALSEYAGFEMVMMAGAMQAAAEDGRIVLVEGFMPTHPPPPPRTGARRHTPPGIRSFADPPRKPRSRAPCVLHWRCWTPMIRYWTWYTPRALRRQPRAGWQLATIVKARPAPCPPATPRPASNTGGVSAG